MNELHDFDELDEESDSPERERAAKRTTWVSVAVNLGLTLTQVIAGPLVRLARSGSRRHRLQAR